MKEMGQKLSIYRENLFRMGQFFCLFCIESEAATAVELTTLKTTTPPTTTATAAAEVLTS